MTRRLVAVVAAVVAALALWPGTTAPGLTAAGEAAVGPLIGCADAARDGAAPAVGQCAAVSPAAPSTLPSARRNVPLGLAGIAAVLLVAMAATVMAPAPRRLPRHLVLGHHGARAPPFSMR